MTWGPYKTELSLEQLRRPPCLEGTFSKRSRLVDLEANFRNFVTHKMSKHLKLLCELGFFDITASENIYIDEICCDLTLTSGWGNNLEINIPQKARISNPFRTPDQPNDIFFRRIYSDWRLQGTLTWTCCGTKIYVQVLLHGVWREWLGPAMGMKSTDGSLVFPKWYEVWWFLVNTTSLVQFALCTFG